MPKFKSGDKALKVFVAGSGGRVKIGQDPKSLLMRHLTLRRGQVYEISEPDEIAALERTGEIGLNYIPLDEKNRPIKAVSGKQREHVLALIKSGVASAKLQLPEFQNVQAEPVKPGPEGE